MLHIVEIPHQRPVKVWLALDEADFIKKMNEANIRSGEVIFDCKTPRTMLLDSGETVESATQEDNGFTI